MSKLVKKIQLIALGIRGECIKLCCDLKMIRFNKTSNHKSPHNIIISLTSYGRRVSKTLPYTIISLLKQTIKPDHIILWLDQTKWSDENLPKSLLKLKKAKYIDVRYCEDIKSYKKLIPTIELFPDSLIITCDDDIYYHKRMVERLLAEYNKDPQKIYTHRAHKLTFMNNGELKPYNNWDLEIYNESGYLIFPTGGGGCLYQKKLMYKDLCKKELFLNLCPKADDVWFYFMEILQGTKNQVLTHENNVCIPLDLFYQYIHKDASLSSFNCKESQNDVQIKAVMDYYHITSQDILNK